MFSPIKINAIIILYIKYNRVQCKLVMLCTIIETVYLLQGETMSLLDKKWFHFKIAIGLTQPAEA